MANYEIAELQEYCVVCLTGLLTKPNTICTFKFVVGATGTVSAKCEGCRAQRKHSEWCKGPPAIMQTPSNNLVAAAKALVTAQEELEKMQQNNPRVTVNGVTINTAPAEVAALVAQVVSDCQERVAQATGDYNTAVHAFKAARKAAGFSGAKQMADRKTAELDIAFEDDWAKVPAADGQ